jgi:hypothetical protein
MDAKIAPKNVEAPYSWGAEFIETGTDHQGTEIRWTSENGKFPSGYHISGNNEIAWNIEIVNYLEEQKEFFLNVEIEYLPGLVGGNTQNQLVDIRACDSVRKVAISRDGPVNTTSGMFQVLKDGNIIDARKWG